MLDFISISNEIFYYLITCHSLGVLIRNYLLASFDINVPNSFYHIPLLLIKKAS